MTRSEMIAELERLEPSRHARALHMQRDDDALRAAIDRMRQAEAESRRSGHIAATGVDLRVVGRATDLG